MKKLSSLLRFILICCLSVCDYSNTLSAQSADETDLNKGQFVGGLRLGLSGNQIFGDGYGGYNKLGISAGPLVRTKLKQNLELQLELNYSHKGSRDPARPDKGKYTSYKISANYIDIPVMFKFWVWKFKFEAGVINAIYLNHTEQNQYGEIPNSEEVALFSRYQLEGSVGIYYPINDKWSGNARFTNSITPASQGWYNWVPGYGLAGGMMNNNITFGLIRYFNPQ